jgi:hypothetical protein
MSPIPAADIDDDALRALHEDVLGPVEDSTMARLRRFRDVLAQFDQTWNDSLLDPDILLHPDDLMPTAPTSLAVLASCWRRNVPLGDLARIGSQPAAQCRDLRNKHHVVFAGNGRDYVEQHPSLGTTRRIQGFASGRILEERDLIRLSPKDRQAFLKGKRDPLTGSASTLEIDHRTPAAAARKVGRAPDTLSKTDLEDGSAEELFQALNKTTNARKREVCAKCLDGGEIEIPPVAAAGKPDGHWRRRFEDPRATDLPPEAPPCLGCFWHRQEHSFEQACRRWRTLNPPPQDGAPKAEDLRAATHGTTFPTPIPPPPEA